MWNHEQEEQAEEQEWQKKPRKIIVSESVTVYVPVWGQCEEGGKDSTWWGGQGTEGVSENDHLDVAD